MQKLLACLSLLFLSGCVDHDAHYYQTHPAQLETALRDCSLEAVKSAHCEELARTAISVNKLAYQLQLNPQGFGQKILFLQQELSHQEQALKQNANQPNLIENYNSNKQQLLQYLAIVKWLESPES